MRLVYGQFQTLWRIYSNWNDCYMSGHLVALSECNGILQAIGYGAQRCIYVLVSKFWQLQFMRCHLFSREYWRVAECLAPTWCNYRSAMPTV